MSRILITSALPYINGVKHLGNLAGSQLPADVFARFARARGDEVIYICATDDHGTPAELGAAQAGQDVETYCLEQHELQREIGSAFGISWDWFGRSSSRQNRELTQHFAAALEDNGFIEERVDRMIYSVDDQRFLPDRYVAGTCPHCGYRPARGDQCDNCGKLLDPAELIDPVSTISGSTRLEMRETRHLYLLQSKLVDRIRAWIDTRKEWSSIARSIAYKHLNDGLRDRGITRDLTWGVPVSTESRPRPGFENKVYYVWFDAPIEYIAATQEWSEATGADWRSWWRTDEGADDVKYLQFMGKDNVAFHSVSFPATLLGSGEPWKMVDVLKAFNWLNWYGGKFSTSEKRGVFMDQALTLLPADYWRWYLTANSPEGSDTNFTWEQFRSSINQDLANVLGNFVNRVVKFGETRFAGVVPAGGEAGPLEKALYDDLSARIERLTSSLNAVEIRKSAQELRALWAMGNEYLTEAAPWTELKTDPPRAAFIIRTAINLIGLFARVSAPFIPFSARRMAEAVGDPPSGAWPTSDGAAELATIAPGRSVASPGVLFTKLEDDQIEAWKLRFGGEE